MTCQLNEKQKKCISEDRQKSLVGSPPTHKDEKQIEDEQKIVNKSKVIFLVIDQIGGEWIAL